MNQETPLSLRKHSTIYHTKTTLSSANFSEELHSYILPYPSYQLRFWRLACEKLTWFCHMLLHSLCGPFFYIIFVPRSAPLTANVSIVYCKRARHNVVTWNLKPETSALFSSHIYTTTYSSQWAVNDIVCHLRLQISNTDKIHQHASLVQTHSTLNLGHLVNWFLAIEYSMFHVDTL